MTYLRTDLFGNPARGKDWGPFDICGNCNRHRPCRHDDATALMLCELCSDLQAAIQEPDFADLTRQHRRRSRRRTA